MSSILVLPIDIFLQIFESLEARSLLACLQVCHQLNDIISQSVTLTYKIKLFALGMCDNLQDDADMSHRSSMLTAYDEALRELKWTRYEMIDLQNMSDPCVSDGLLVFRVAGRLTPPNQTRLVVFQLPSALRGVRARRWYLDFDFSFYSFIIDAPSDLLVISCGSSRHIQQLGLHLHLCSLSTGDKHPLSQTDGIIRALDLEVQWWYDFDKSSRIRGDYLAFLVISPSPWARHSLFLWNWHSGTLVVDTQLHLPCYAYSFLDDRRLVLIVGNSTATGRGRVRLHVYSWDESSQNAEDPLAPCLEAIYILPDGKIPRGRVDEVRLCSSPGQSVPTGHFYRNTALTEAVLILGLAVPGTSLWHEFNLIIPVCALKTPAPRHGGGHGPASWSFAGYHTSESAPEVPWSEWGHAVTSDECHAFSSLQRQLPSSLYALPFASGSRAVMHKLVTRQNRGAVSTSSRSPAGDTVDRQSKMFVVTDYYPRRVARAIARGDPRIKHSQSPTLHTDVPSTRTYLRVQATLPAELQSIDPGFVCAAMCGDAVLLFQCAKDAEPIHQMEKLHVFTF
ncbi:hypothetical protein BC826DRAFT_352983 [Russula brevipes]|nr:hypothetical protein BC826DRAFT_352983 [Russula brevipes]